MGSKAHGCKFYSWGLEGEDTMLRGGVCKILAALLAHHLGAMIIIGVSMTRELHRVQEGVHA